MSVSRRRFLQSSAAAAIGCAASPLFAGNGHTKTPGTPTTGSKTTMLPAPGRLAFSSAVGSSFEVTSESLSQPVWLRLLAVDDPPAITPVNTASMAVPPPKHAKSKTTTGFVLSFSGGPTENLAQGTYTFQSSSLGKFSLFIVPGGPQQYSAVFNHV